MSESEMSENSASLPEAAAENAVQGETGAVKTRGGFVHSDGFVMLIIYCTTLLIHVLMSLCSTIFNLTPDEYSVTAVAAYFNGYDWLASGDGPGHPRRAHAVGVRSRAGGTG